LAQLPHQSESYFCFDLSIVYVFDARIEQGPGNCVVLLDCTSPQPFAVLARIPRSQRVFVDAAAR